MNPIVDDSVKKRKDMTRTPMFYGLLIVEIAIIITILQLMPHPFYVTDPVTKMKILNPVVYSFLGLAVILAWIGVLLYYYCWSIYFYNINLGRTEADWEKIHKRIYENKLRKEAGEDIPEEEMVVPNNNPYHEETFGLPAGTVRGTIALTLLVGGIALLFFSFSPTITDKQSEIFEKAFEFFKTAFLMMVAFYFGSQSLKYLKTAPTSVASPAPAKPDENKSIPSIEIPKVDTTTAEKPAPEASTSGLKSNVEIKPIAVEIRQEIAKKLTEDEINDTAKVNKLEPALIKAVLEVESKGDGFLANGQPKILFEGHIFWNQLTKKEIDPTKYAAAYPDIVYKSWTKQYYLGGEKEYTRLEKAKLIDEEAALKATSWGLFQIMGFNHQAAGYSTVNEFVAAQKTSEKAQLDSFINFIKFNKLDTALKEHRWKDFAKGYNGPQYELNKYDIKLEDAFDKFCRSQNTLKFARLKRTVKNSKQTLGQLDIISGEQVQFSCKTLELPWKNNEKSISCIPEGKYTVIKRVNERFNKHFLLQEVPNRDYICIHAGNYINQTHGCILAGLDHKDIDSDGFLDVTSSKVTIEKLYSILPDKFEIEIV